MLKVATVLPHEPYREYKDVERVYSGSTEIDKILDKNGNVLFAVNKEVEGTPALAYKGKEETNLKNYRIYGNTETKTRSYSGSAPLSFPIEDGAVSNYMIYGNTVNGESVGELVTDSQSEHYGKYAIPITNNSETANIYLDEPLRKVGDEAEYVDYATQKWHRVRKNLCPYESTNNTIIGHVKQGKTYTFSFYALYECGFNLQKRNADSGQTSMLTTRSKCNGNVEVTFQADENFDLYLNGYSQTTGKTSTDCISKLQLEESSAATSYEPYIENTEVDVTIPDLPAQSSTNSLSVGTVVQPSSVAVDVAEVVSCGDRTENLFDGSFIHRSVIMNAVGDDDPNRRSIVVDISSLANGDKITFSREMGVGNVFQMYQVSSPRKGGILLNDNVVSGDSNTLLATITLDNISNYPYLIIFLNGAAKPITDEELLASKIMVNVGNTPLPYEPYHAPIYLPEPIKMVGDEAEYIDYAEQKQHRVGADDIDVTLPELPTLSGTNTLTVGTEVQPSNVYLKGRIKEVS